MTISKRLMGGLLLGLLSFSSVSAETDAANDSTPSRFAWGLAAITEGQLNLKSGEGAWANRLDLNASVGLWRGATFEAAAMATYRTGREVGDPYQDFSNINSPGRPFRLTHFGLAQSFLDDRLSLYLGIRQADEDYWNTSVAGIFTGASYGCLPTVNDNFHVNVFPLSALGFHVEYRPAEHWAIRTTLYNGRAYDTLDRIFRFRPKTDGVINLGSVSYSKESEGSCPHPTTFLLGWNVGNHRRDASLGRHTQAGLWATIEHPIVGLGRVHLTAAGTVGHEFKDPEAAKTSFNIALAADNLTRRGGALGVGFSRALYTFGHESDLETSFLMPLGAGFSLRPALHFLRTDGRNRLLGQLRVEVEI